MAKKKAKTSSSTKKAKPFKKTIKVGNKKFTWKSNHGNKTLYEKSAEVWRDKGYEVRSREYKQSDGTSGRRLYTHKKKSK